MQLPTTGCQMLSAALSSGCHTLANHSEVVFLSVMAHRMEHPMASLGQLSQLHPLPAACGCLTEQLAAWEAENTLTKCKLNISILSVYSHPKSKAQQYTTIATRNKFNFTPVKCSTVYFQISVHKKEWSDLHSLSQAQILQILRKLDRKEEGIV